MKRNCRLLAIKSKFNFQRFITRRKYLAGKSFERKAIIEDVFMSLSKISEHLLPQSLNQPTNKSWMNSLAEIVSDLLFIRFAIGIEAFKKLQIRQLSKRFLWPTSHSD